MLKKFGIALLGLLLPVAIHSPSFAGTKEELIKVQGDVLNLQKQVLELQRTSDDNAKDIKNLLQLLNEQLAKSNATLTSIKDGLQNQQADMRRAVDDVLKQTSGLGERLDETNSRITTLSEKIGELRVRVQEEPPRTSGSFGEGAIPPPDQLYRTAYRDFLEGNYDLALQELQTYVTRYPDTERADDAQYYIGEALLFQKKFNDAIQAFDQVIMRYPTSKLIPSAHYKKGIALQQLNRTSEAIEQFRFVAQNYPKSPEANLAKERLDRLGASPRMPRKTSSTPNRKRRSED